MRIGPAAAGLVRQPTRTLDRDYVHQRESGVPELAAQFLGKMEEGRSEVLRPTRRVAMAAIAEILGDDRLEFGIIDKPVVVPRLPRPRGRATPCC